jgi:SpoVK/Ycf46/Vps4 family AAA+-type ATPase
VDQARLLESMRRAVARQPDDEALRTHLAELLVEAGLGSEAVAHVGLLLAADPSNPQLQALMSQAIGGHPIPSGPPPASGTPEAGAAEAPGFDWGAAEADLIGGLAHEPVERLLRLSDVGGLAAVKDRIESTFLLALRNPELRERYGKSLRGGLLLYGPPGCGKTYLARAVAGELGAKFITVSLNEVLSRWVGQSEANISEVFAYARAQAPCVMFFDEVDALGHKRSGLGQSGGALRGAVNQLLTELDGVGTNNEGVFVLGATNAPWDVDVAMRRPGRFDRAVFVEPPDEPARAEILSNNLAGMPVDSDVDLMDLARRTPGFSGADLAHVCQTAAEAALADAARNPGAARNIGSVDLRAAVAGITPSTGRWFDAARNVVLFADAAGEYSALATYMKAHRLL